MQIPKPDRRTFLRNSLLFSGATLLGSTACGTDTPVRPHRNHPLEGIQREEIRITDVKVTLLSAEVPPEEQWYLDWIPERYKCWKTDSILVEVFTDAGIKGIGGSTQYGVSHKVRDYILSYVAPIIIGQNPFDVEYLTCGVVRRNPDVAWAGVDAACWDIIGKVAGKPVYELLAIDHEPATAVPVYASAGEMYDGDTWPDNLVEEALRFQAAGFKGYKFRPGTHWSVSGMTMDRYIEGVRKIREAVGEDFDLIQECNAQWNMEQAMQFIPAAESMNLLWIEDPVQRLGPEARTNYRKIKDALGKVKLSYGGDVMNNRYDYKSWIDQDAMHIVQPDAGVMGLTEAWYVSRMAHLRGQQCCPHNWHGDLLTIANAHLAAGIPNLLLLETARTYNPLRGGLFTEPLTVKDGRLMLPDKPGFGVEVLPDVEKKFPYIPGVYDRPRDSQ